MGAKQSWTPKKAPLLVVGLGYAGHRVSTFDHYMSCHISQKEGKYTGKQNGRMAKRKGKKISTNR